MTVETEILKELTKIRSLLEPEEEPVVEVVKPKGMKGRSLNFKEEFVGFIKKYKVMGLAVAFIMALYLGGLVQALVDDLIMPIISYVPGIETWDTWALGPFLIGHFLGTLLTFFIVTLVIFIIVKITSKIGIE